MEMNTKKWYQSYTVWFNIILLAVATINELSSIVPVSADFIAWLGVLGNLVLRFKTQLPIE